MSYSGGYGGDSSIKIKVDSSDVGKIIGRGGTKIRDMEASCGVKIKIDREAESDGMKGVEIIGQTEESVEKARSMINDSISGADFDGGRRGGGGGGYGGSRGGRGGSGGGYGGRRGDSGGSYGRRDRDGGDGWGGRRDDRGSRGGGGGRGGYSDGDDSETLIVESSEVGRIIGRGGQRIRDMEECSGCKIKVNRDDGRGRSSVDLFGSKAAISTAKGLITEAGVEFVNGDDRGRGW